MLLIFISFFFFFYLKAVTEIKFVFFSLSGLKLEGEGLSILLSASSTNAGDNGKDTDEAWLSL